jgi:hypothetical protein
MKFAYHIQISGEFLAIGDDGKIVNRQSIQPTPLDLDEAFLTNLVADLLRAKESFLAAAGIHQQTPALELQQ